MPFTLLNSTSLDAFGASLYSGAQYQQVVNGNIAPRLDNLTTGAIFSAFANANETVTSAHGHGWLA